MKQSVQLDIPLFAEGTKDASFRLRNQPGELQRAHIMQEGSDLTVQANITSVLHGTLTPDGDYATLLVIEYRFQGSLTRSTRFKSAMIKVKFTTTEDDLRGRPIVRSVAPDGTFFLNSETADITDTLSANGSAKVGAGPVILGVDAGWERSTSVKRESHTTLVGTTWIDGRDAGKPNMGRWKLTENKSKKDGIPSMLRTAILVTQKVPLAFQAIVSIQTEANLAYALKKEARSFIGGKKVDIVDPVNFAAGEARQSVGVGLPGVAVQGETSLGAKQGVVSSVEDGSTALSVPSYHAWLIFVLFILFY
ncbi:hypothetical protein ANOM_006032 [Aspergillus nomiae NRRL 13137]|uniref:Uncharacterized protein n=1 Tax=Aspergillus nomiae NRRL (strain ATCC 15546 / NRRL 13137 / CBS 260.88 / M93) TaxID=1509407 RepID=A0A0L1J1F4_ASPN3|nr:uncharacterized protein ANOM_006032 [Aspergillus nomiae NRRL 13137]KNG85641.1 hypothetical protein ANOM_006032 [Aspergillus nomiae NRRL 13137]